MKKILFIAVVAMFAFTVKPSTSLQPVSPESAKKPCGAILFFNNPGGASVYRIVVDWANYPDQTYYYPTFPFNTGTRCCGGGVTLIINFTSGSGTIEASDSNGLLACETFQAPYISPIVFSTSCDDYVINLTDNASCP